tara:strand:+ start:1574 stop:1750 length:177 start_codon:yes stop_codon:yes gene_type:complete
MTLEEKFYPTVKKLYPKLDDKLITRISQFCVLYSDGEDIRSVKKAIKNFSQTFEQELK